MSVEKVTGRLRHQCEDVLRLTRMLEPDLREIADKAQENAELTERLLRAVNSASSGLQHSISNVQHALAYLGTRKVTKIIEEMLPALPPPPPDSSPQQTTQQTPHSRKPPRKTETQGNH